jgi:surfeit locus 1 family protein
MLRRLRQARLIWPTLAALAGLAVLIGLGTWQMERRRWKEDLLARIAARVHADPIALISRRPCQPGGGILLKNAVAECSEQPGLRMAFEVREKEDDAEYTHVVIRGRFLHDKERYLYAPEPRQPGWHVFTPLQEEDGRNIVWINRGFVPDGKKAPGTRIEGQATGDVEVRGLVRIPARKGLFTPENDPAHNLWYWPDLPAMTAAAFPEGAGRAEVEPFFIDADARPEPPGGLPRGGVTRLQLPNRHLEYAVTWYGLAATLLGVYLAFAISRLRGVN